MLYNIVNTEINTLERGNKKNAPSGHNQQLRRTLYFSITSLSRISYTSILFWTSRTPQRKKKSSGCLLLFSKTLFLSSEKPSAGSYTWVKTTLCNTPSLGNSDWETAHWKRTWGCWLTVPEYKLLCAQMTKTGSGLMAPAGPEKWFSTCAQHRWSCTSNTELSFGALTIRRTLRCWSMCKKDQWSWWRV